MPLLVEPGLFINLRDISIHKNIVSRSKGGVKFSSGKQFLFFAAHDLPRNVIGIIGAPGLQTLAMKG